MFKPVFRIIVMLMAASCLQACMNVATSGASMVYNRKSIEKNLKDHYLTLQAYRALYYNTDRFSDANISISTYHQDILLAGQAPKAWQKTEAETLIRKIPDVDRIYNLISINSPSSSLTRISDGWITTKIKAKLLASDETDGSQIKVVTENGTVFLMGTLLPEHADAAVELARNTDGVQRVVRVFSYMKISRKRKFAQAF